MYEQQKKRKRPKHYQYIQLDLFGTSTFNPEDNGRANLERVQFTPTPKKLPSKRPTKHGRTRPNYEP